MLTPLTAATLLSECDGEEIWSETHCRARGVPAIWIEEHLDCFESGFDQDSETIYLGDVVVNQYRGVRAVDLAIKLGEFLGVDTASLQARYLTRSSLVRAIQEEYDDG